MSLGRNIFWNLAAFLWLTLLIILVTPYMVRKLGLDAFGAWTVQVAFTTYLVAMDFGLANGLIRFLSTQNERRDTETFEAYLRSGLSLLMLLGTLAAGLLFGLSSVIATRVLHVPPILGSEVVTSLRVASLFVWLSFPLAAFNAVPAALHRFDILALRTFLFFTAQYVLFVTALAVGGGLVGVSLALVFATCLMLAYMIMMSFRLLPGVRLLPGWRSIAVRELLRFGRFKFPGQLAAALLQQSDRFVLASALPVARVSYYGVPIRLAQRLSQVVEQIGAPFYPAVASHIAGRREEELGTQYRHGIRLVMAVAGAGLVVVGGLAHPILAVWLGADFADAGAWPLRILLLAYSASALFLLPSVAADAAGRPGIPAGFLCVGALVHLPLLFLLISRFQLVGAALAVLVGFLVPMLFGTPWIHRRVPGLPRLGRLFQDTGGVAAAVLVGGSASSWIATTTFPHSGVAPLVVSLAGAVLLYVGLLFLFRGLRGHDVRSVALVFRPGTRTP